jgi:drug/metabolite transporter (DMT)-like permease
VTRAPGVQVWGPLIGLWLIWGSTYLATAVLIRSVPPLIGTGMRFLVAAVLLAAILAVARGPAVLRVSPAQLRSTATMGVMLLGVGIGTVGLSERYVPSGVVALLVAVTPLWIIVFRIRAGERPSVPTITGVAIGMAGLAVMLLPGGTHAVAGNDNDVAFWSLAMMVSSFCWALFSWRSARYDLPANTLVTTAYEMAFGSVALIVAGMVTGERLHLDQVQAGSGWAWLYLVGASLAGYSAFTWLIGNAPLSLVSTYAYVNPVVAVLLGWLIIGEPVTSDVILGLTVVVGGVMLVVTGERRR